MSVTTRSPSPTTAKPLEFELLYQVEARHFWFRTRNRMIETVVRQLIRGWPRDYRVLEIGCGTGYVLSMLERVCVGGQVVGTELFEEGLQFARQRVRCPVLQADAYNLPFQSPFHLIGLFDVLEHLPDDGLALRRLRRHFHPDGKLLLTVPAHMALWSHFDEFSQHYRRYSPASLRATLKQAGYRVEYLTQFMAAAFPLMWLARRFAASNRPTTPQELTQRSLRELQINRLLNLILELAHVWEPVVVRLGGQLPVGTSLLAVASPESVG